MNCLAIDDEPLALNVIQEFCSKISSINLVGTCSNAVDATRIINEQKIDLIFLDINMPHLTGLDFIKTLVNPPLIIFTTAYSEHALEGFELNAVDYLVKPIPFERFLKALNKAQELYKLRNQKVTVDATTENHQSVKKNYMMVKVEYSMVRVDFKDIKYIEGVKDYLKIVLPGKSLLAKSTMKNMEEKLPPEQFIRVHKSYIVSIPNIEKIERNRIIYGDKYIPVGDLYKDEFYRILDEHKL
jgi:DNA-binding LytR/AlgR family response regulator